MQHYSSSNDEMIGEKQVKKSAVAQPYSLYGKAEAGKGSIGGKKKKRLVP